MTTASPTLEILTYDYAARDLGGLCDPLPQGPSWDWAGNPIPGNTAYLPEDATYCAAGVSDDPR